MTDAADTSRARHILVSRHLNGNCSTDSCIKFKSVEVSLETRGNKIEILFQDLVQYNLRKYL